MAEAIEVVGSARHLDGTWHQQLRHEGRTWFEVDTSPGQASRWLTFHATRVLGWWDEGLQVHHAARHGDDQRTPR